MGQNKRVVEGTTGFWYKPYNGPKGRLQFGMQYSYLVRTAWVGYRLPPYTGLPGSSTIAPKAIEKCGSPRSATTCCKQRYSRKATQGGRQPAATLSCGLFTPLGVRRSHYDQNYPRCPAI